MPALFAVLSLFFVDFTFNVPVNLQDYHQPSSVVGSSQSIYCTVQVIGPTGIMTDAGTGRTPIAIPESGNFNATVTVQVTMQGSHRPSEARGYRCWLTVADGVPASTKVTSGELRPRSGTTPVLLVTGTLNR